MRKFSVIVGLLALLSVKPAAAIAPAGGVEVITGFRVLVQNPGAISAASESEFVAGMAAQGFRNAAVAKTIYAGLQGTTGLQQVYSKMNLESGDWAKLEKLAAPLSQSEVVGRIMDSVRGTQMKVTLETLTVAFAAEMEPAAASARSIVVTDEEVDSLRAELVPTNKGWAELLGMGSSGDNAEEAQLEQALRLAVFARKSAPTACGPTCSREEIAELANLGVEGVGMVARFVYPLNDSFVREALAQDGQFRNAPFANARYRAGLLEAGKDASEGALSEELEHCLINN